MKNKKLNNLIGQKLLALRNDLHLTQRQMAKKIGVSYQQLHKYEIGRDRITFARMLELEKQLGFQIIEQFRDLEEFQLSDTAP